MDNYELLDQLTRKLHSETPGYVVGVGYGLKRKNNLFTGEKGIIFTVTKKKPIEEIPSNEILPKIVEHLGHTFTTDVVEGNFSYVLACPSDFYSWQSTPPINRGGFRPLKGGVSTTNYTSLGGFVGTLGFLAVDSMDNSLVGVSNNHVYCHEAFYTAERIFNLGATNTFQNVTVQPHPYDYGLWLPNQYPIGVVKRYNPISYIYTNYADVSLTTINQSDIDYSESWKIAGLTGWTQPMTFALSGELNSILTINPYLFSSGRTTGPKGEGDTKLFVEQSPVAIQIAYNLQGVQQTVVMAGCISYFASASTTPAGQSCPFPINGGDSGSALLAEIGGVRKIVGLCFGGAFDNNGNLMTGLANRIDYVADAIKIHAWTGQTVNFSNVAASETFCSTGGAYGYNKSIILSGKTFWQVGFCTLSGF